MKAKELQALSVEELQARLNSEEDAYYKLKLAHAVSPIENPMRIRATRRLIARIHTVLTAKQTIGNK
jgi:large subunit ribosomal protein L29